MSETMEHDEMAADPRAEVYVVAARAPVRSRLAADVDAFLAGGGSIEEVPKDFRADPPRRLENRYGRSAI
ncbi:MAG: hypothetical protein ACNA7W_02525 [Pseudomonadales bacterium]